MNWAMIAPEHRLYKGKSIFRWEVSPGLEHHCGICQTPLHNARAKTSCIGKHVEPCYRFHQQLHFVGRSHECFGCNHSDEMHHMRHKEILTLVRKIAAADGKKVRNTPTSPLSLSPSKLRPRSVVKAQANTATDTSSEGFGEDVPKMRRSERKKAKKLGIGCTSKRRMVEAFAKEDTDFISEAIHLSIYETKGAWEGTYVYGNKQLEVENPTAKAENSEDRTGKAASLSVNSPKALTPRQRKTAKKIANAIKHPVYRGGSRKSSPNFVSKTDPYDGLDPQIFFRLGVEIINPPWNSVARKDLVSKLVSAVKVDLDIIAQEEEETEMRADGFWRWAGKSAHQEIMDRREELDWATGQKKGSHSKCAFVEVGFEEIGEDSLTDFGQRIVPFVKDYDLISEEVDLNVTEEEIHDVEEMVKDYEQQSTESFRQKRCNFGADCIRSGGGYCFS